MNPIEKALAQADDILAANRALEALSTTFTTVRVETTGLVRGERRFTVRTVEWDGRIEYDFIAAREDVPAQHRIFVRGDKSHERYVGVRKHPLLITRFVED